MQYSVPVSSKLMGALLNKAFAGEHSGYGKG